MKCIFCNYEETQVIDTRISEDKLSIKRRRKCIQCDRRVSTLEKIDLQMPMVVKSNHTIEEFDENKIYMSFTKALQKRPVSIELVYDAIDIVRQNILKQGEREIESQTIGKFVMAQLIRLDKVAYIRFASVYLSFEDINDFSKFIQQIHAI